jgi:hypothetical protein
MKVSFNLFLLFFMLLVLPTSKVKACGNNAGKEITEQTATKSQDDQLVIKGCCSNDEESNDGCGQDCCDSSCSCPISINLPVFMGEPVLSFRSNFITTNKEWAYIQPVPAVVYLSIWLPPKIA